MASYSFRRGRRSFAQAADSLPPPRVAVGFMCSVSHSRIYRDKSGGESWCRRHESCLYQLRALRFTQIFRQVPAAGRAPRHRKLPARTSCERSRGTGAPRARARDAHRISHRAPRSAPIAARPAQPRRRARSAGASPQFRESRCASQDNALVLRCLRAITKERTWHDGVLPVDSRRALGAVWFVCRQTREPCLSHAVCAYRAAAWARDASRLPLERTAGLASRSTPCSTEMPPGCAASCRVHSSAARRKPSHSWEAGAPAK